MGESGPIRKQNSVRGLKEGVAPLDAPEQVKAPAWLSKDAKKEFKALVISLIAADVPIKQVDCYSIGMAAQCITSVAKWSELEEAAESLSDKLDCSKQLARYQRDSQNWLAAICATPTARVRIGIKSTQKKAGPLAELLERKKLNAEAT